jgi:serine phosphatase RsbU (regulator of sigma subunit)
VIVLKRSVKALAAVLIFLVWGLSSGWTQTVYWAEPEVLEEKNVQFLQADSGGGLVTLVWQEFIGEQSYLSLKVSRDLRKWISIRRFAGPFKQESQETPLFSLAVDNEARIYLAIASAPKRITLMISEDDGKTFSTTQLESSFDVIAPRLFIRGANRGLYLFVVHSTLTSLTIYYTPLERDAFTPGRLYTELKPFVREADLRLSFLPHYAYFRGKEYVVFQYQPGRAERYQLYLKASDRDGNFSLEEDPIQLTSFSEQRDGDSISYIRFDNQRPHLAALSDRLAVAWERSYANEPYQVYYMEIDENGRPMGVGGAALPDYRVTSNRYNCLAPRVFLFGGNVNLVWFDNRRGENHIIMATKMGELWEELDLSRLVTGTSIYPWPVLSGKYLNIFWENQSVGKSRIVSLAPDQWVDPPRLIARNFIAGRPTRGDVARIAWTLPRDISGIEGFAYAWSRTSYPQIGGVLAFSSDTSATTVEASEDGSWYFHLAAKDFAGNWSEPSTIEFIRDTTPPGPIRFEELLKDEGGYLTSNNPNFSWTVSEAEPLSGYTYSLERIAADFKQQIPESLPGLSAPQRVLTQQVKKSYVNIDNGIWIFGVSAIDIAGNVGPLQILAFRANKYIPVTIVSSIAAEEDILGRVKLKIIGRGFTEEGIIQEVLLDRDTKEPFDYTFTREDNDFVVKGDRLLEGPSLEFFEEGTYRVGLIHSKRGLYFSRESVTLTPLGTVKLGDYSTPYKLSWRTGERPEILFSSNHLILLLVLVFLAFVFVVAASKLVTVAREGRELRNEVLALLTSAETAERKELKMKELKRQGLGLRAKFTMLIALLVVLIVLIVSVPLSYTTIRTQTKTMAQGLQDRAKVLLGSISAGSESGLLDQETLPLGNQINQISAMPEAQYATITGITPRDSSTPGQGEEYVWASNDKNIGNKLREKPSIASDYEAGRSIIEDEVSTVVSKMAQEINRRAQAEVSQTVGQLDELFKELRSLFDKTDAASVARAEELASITAALEARINRSLRQIASDVSSIPEFDYRNLQKYYNFYAPIVYRKGGEDIFFRGVVRLGISAEGILKEIEESQRQLIKTIGVIALASIALGILGALILASITISPIKKLVAGVALIRDTEDKEALKDHIIDIKQKDELRMLADTVNEMTQGLVKAAAASKELIVGKEIQKMFIPLEQDEQGNKGTAGGERTEKVEIFGFYEGAKGVSGDYFDYKKLDEEHYAIIKCDVAGKGVPAALIMVEVATIFLTYFRNWTIKDPGLRIDRLAYTINDMLEERGFKGRFAALILCILNVDTGVMYLCNAGDNIVHIYNGSRQRMTQKTLPESPAAGVFPSTLVKTQSSFKLVKDKLNTNDTLFLFTDGIEEAQRLFRDESYTPIKCEEEGIEEGESHGGTHSKGAEFEELGIPRIQQILNAVYNRESYRLLKYHNPNPEEELIFDFSTCKGSVEEAVLAMVSVEKVFRMYQPPSVGPEETVTVDRRIDAFLQEHFGQYSLYFAHRIERENEKDTVTFSHLMEDSQYDDLTILGIKKG